MTMPTGEWDGHDRRSYDAERLRLLRWMIRLLVVFIVSLLILSLAVGAYAYQGRKANRDIGYQRCLIGSAALVTNARGWRIAEQRARTQGQVGFSRLYDESAADLERRAGLRHPITAREARGSLSELLEASKLERAVSCLKAWPKVPVLDLPW